MWIPLNDYRLLPAVSGIYVIRHRESGREYVGQSKNVRKRMVGHRAASSPHFLGRALRLYGLAAFDVCLLIEAPVAELGDLEIKTIAERGTFAPAGFNALLGGLGPTGAVMTAEWRAAQSARVRGVPLAPETKEKMRLSALANNPFRGKTHSDEARAKMAQSAVQLHTGAKRSDQARANISASLKGRAAPVLSAEARERIAASRRGKPSPGCMLTGAKNGMFGKAGAQKGKFGASHSAARPVGVWLPESMTPMTFGSVVEAASWAGMTGWSITLRCTGRRAARDGSVWCYL